MARTLSDITDIQGKLYTFYNCLSFYLSRNIKGDKTANNLSDLHANFWVSSFV